MGTLKEQGEPMEDPEILRRAWASMPDPAVHPGDEEILAHLLSPAGDERVLRHLAGCGRCRGVAAGLAPLVEERVTAASSGLGAKRRAWGGWTAAAAGILAVAGWLAWRPDPPGRVPDASAPVAAASWPAAAPGARLEGRSEGLRVLWSRTGGALNLGPLAEARLGASDQALALVSGRAWARLEGAFRIDTPQGFLQGRAASATVALEVGPPSAGALSWLVRGALAESVPPVRVALIEGEAVWVSPGGREVALAVGQEVRVEGGVPRPGVPVDGRWFAGLAPAWRPADAGDVTDRAGASRLPGGAWRLEPGTAPASLFWAWPPGEGDREFLIRPSGRSTAALVFRAGGELREWMLPPGAELKVRLGRQGGWISGSLDGRRLWGCPESGPAMDRFAGAARVGDLGILVWGDPLEVEACRSDASLPGVVVE
jgi:hypothetical protein